MSLEYPHVFLEHHCLPGVKTSWGRLSAFSRRRHPGCASAWSVHGHTRSPTCRNSLYRMFSTAESSQWNVGKGLPLSIQILSSGSQRGEGHVSSVQASAAADEAGFTTSPPATSATSPDNSSSEENRGSGSNNLIERLKACGIAGVISYGILNTLYYLTAFLVVFLKVSPLERGAGFAAAAKHCIMLLAVVWAGSQVTKVPRVLGALMLTPWVDRVLHWLTSTNRARSKASVLAISAAVCFGAAGLVFLCLVALWA